MLRYARKNQIKMDVSTLTKKVLRERILTLLKNQEEGERLRKSLKILNKLFQAPEFKSSLTILFYASFDGEVETFEMIRQAKKLGKIIGLPRIVRNIRKIVPAQINSFEKGLVSGAYGIKQPHAGSRELSLGSIDLVVVPGVAFDKKNNRLGRGGGYYDAFLKTLPSRIPTIGLAFDFQIVKILPQLESHDIPVSRVLTN